MTTSGMSSNQPRCVLHGVYWGMVCPACNSSIPQTPPPPLDPTLVLQRIATALERIAVAIEGGDAL